MILKKVFLMANFGLALTVLGACAGSEKTAEQAAASAAACGATSMDSSSHELSASCISGNSEQVRLEGVNVGAVQTLVVNAFSSNGADGWEVTFHGASGKVYIKNKVNDQFMSTAALTLNDSATWCIDFHRDEDPNHIVLWKSAGKCDATLASGAWGNADLNSQDGNVSVGDYAARPVSTTGAVYGAAVHASSAPVLNNSCTVGANPACFTGGVNPTGTKFYYKGPSGSLTKMIVKTNLASGL